MIVRSRELEQNTVSAEERAVLDRRAERLRGRPSEETAEATAWVGEFSIGDERYAMPMEALKAAVPLRFVTPVPLAPPHVLGILRFQDQIILAISLASLLGNRAWRRDPTVLLVVEARKGKLVALDCEQVPRTTAVPIRLLQQASMHRTGILTDLPTPDGSVVSLIDLARLIEPVEAAAHDRHGP
jgi:purine-binding chemotaxis protein CheW